MAEVSIDGIPAGSKLILVGDWFRNPGHDWCATCYFWNENENPKTIRRGIPIALLPTMIPGITFPRKTSENQAQGYTGTFSAPPMGKWKKCSYRDLPASLKRLPCFSEEISNQVIYRLEIHHKIYWLPASELARMLFFHSSEVVRHAALQGNTWQLARAEQNDWAGIISLTSNIPVSYLNSVQFRKFFTWLFFNKDAENSFCSIFRELNDNTYLVNGSERCTFDFQLPALSGTSLSWSGYTGQQNVGEQDHCYIREIRSISGLPAPNLDTIYFEHPDDLLVLESDSNEDRSGKKKKEQPQVNPQRIDPNNPPTANKKRYLIKITSSGLHFDIEPDLRRSPRHIHALPNGESPELVEMQEEPTVSLLEGSDHGQIPRADVNNLEAPELVDAPEKMALFEKLLEMLEKEHQWPIEIRSGEVPRKNCRTAHLVEGRARQYRHAKIQRDETTLIQILEVELTAAESLSTLFFRADDKQVTSAEKIIDDLMSSDLEKKLKAMQWKRKLIAERTINRLYLEHPDNKIKNEEDALASWVARAASKILSL